MTGETDGERCHLPFDTGSNEFRVSVNSVFDVFHRVKINR